MTSDQERIAFEKKHCRQFLMDWSSDHQTYWSMPTRMLWQGWQARAAMHIEADRQARQCECQRKTNAVIESEREL